MTKHLEDAIDSSQPNRTMPAKPPEISYFFIFQCLYHQTETIANNVRIQAKKLNDVRWVYGLYGLLDGLSTSFRMLKYTFDIYYANSHLSSADVLHDFLLTPEGIVIVVFESLVLAGLAMSGNVFDDDSVKDQPTWKKTTATFWRYFRDLLKALKNAYKGVRNVFVFVDLLAVGQSLSYLVLPLGLALGALSAINRMFIRFMRDERKVKMKQNEALLKDIKQMKLDATKDLKTWHEIYKIRLEGQKGVEGKDDVIGVQSQSGWYRALSYLAAAYSGFLDAPYLFLGAISLSILNPSLLILMATISVFFVVVCIATRIFEEYNYQRLLFITQTQIELTVCTEELKLLFKKLETIAAKLADENCDPTQQASLVLLQASVYIQFKDKVNEAAKCKEKLNKQSVLSTGSVMMGGLRNGIDAYGAIASLMFVIATIYLILWIPFPPLLLIAFASTGLVLLAGFVGLALITSHYLKTGSDLHSMPDQPNDLTMYKNSYVLIGGKKLAYIDQNGKEEHVEIKDARLFEKFLKAINPQKLKKIHLSDKQINEFITLNSGHTRKTLSTQTQATQKSLDTILDEFKTLTTSENPEVQENLNILKEQILDRLSIDPSPQFFFQEWFEVLRLLCSGGGKGMRSVDETMVSWQDVGNDGHYHDTWIMASVAWVCAIFFAISFALRGLARLGREKEKAAAQTASSEIPPNVDDQKQTAVPIANTEQQTTSIKQTSPRVVASSPVNIEIDSLPTEAVESGRTSVTSSPTPGSLITALISSKPLPKVGSAPNRLNSLNFFNFRPTTPPQADATAGSGLGHYTS